MLNKHRILRITLSLAFMLLGTVAMSENASATVIQDGDQSQQEAVITIWPVES